MWDVDDVCNVCLARYTVHAFRPSSIPQLDTYLHTYNIIMQPMQVRNQLVSSDAARIQDI